MNNIVYDFQNWRNGSQLLENLLDPRIAAPLSESGTEIERKWLLQQYLTDTGGYLDIFKIEGAIVRRHIRVRQWYLSVEPELRFRENVEYFKDEYGKLVAQRPQYYLAHKSNGDMARKEIEIEVNRETAIKIFAYLNSRASINIEQLAVTKDFYVFTIAGTPQTFEYSLVDMNSVSKFGYLEVEFISVEEAEAFTLPIEVGKLIDREITKEKNYKMKNYWAMTRSQYYDTEKIALPDKRSFNKKKNALETCFVEDMIQGLQDALKKFGNLPIVLAHEDGSISKIGTSIVGMELSKPGDSHKERCIMLADGFNWRDE